ncbi:C40 family peptidase [Citricoccus sp. GCM10030269]|uniref:C40 family peptidase n=1 Tax=Citricoccus sp. GCM10030269 TaxID=3273388 RepID=UPI003610BE93
MNYSTRHDRLAAEKLSRRARRRRSLAVGALGVTAAVGAAVSGVAPASANDGGQSASTYQDWSYEGESAGSGSTYSSGYTGSAGYASSSTDYAGDSAASTASNETEYQLASYTSDGGYGSGWQADAAQWAAATASDSSSYYTYGGNGPNGFDCSGFTQSAFAQAGVDIPRTTSAQYAGASEYVGLDDLQVGDLVFWSNNGSASGIYHVAVYIGDGQIAHARNPSVGVTITDVDYSPYNMMGTAARY